MTAATLEGSTVPRWATRCGVGLAALGLALSAYLSIEHLVSDVVLACPPGASFDCTKVTTSAWSRLGGVPVAFLGLGYFVAMTYLVWPSVWRVRSLWRDRARIVGVALGVVMVVYLVWAELFRIGSICLWCTAVHVVTLALFAVVLLAEAVRPRAFAG